jgi:hypothetical protein
MRGQSVVITGVYVPERNVYDPQAERLDRAIAGIWLLWRWARWELLDDLGFTRAEIDKPFREFDMAYVTSERGKLSREDQVTKLLQFLRTKYPELVVRVLGAAMWMVGEYMRRMMQQRIAYFEHQAQGDQDSEYLPQFRGQRSRGRGAGGQVRGGRRGGGRTDQRLA